MSFSKTRFFLSMLRIFFGFHDTTNDDNGTTNDINDKINNGENAVLNITEGS